MVGVGSLLVAAIALYFQFKNKNKQKISQQPISNNNPYYNLIIFNLIISNIIIYISQEMPKPKDIINTIYHAAALLGLTVGYSMIGKNLLNLMLEILLEIMKLYLNKLFQYHYQLLLEIG